jgi:hypothetical protein
MASASWSISFQCIKQNNSAAADLLNLCAFLDADMIPEEIITEGWSELGPILGPVAANPFKFNEAIKHLLRFSLIRRESEEKWLSIHRLVQAVLKDTMDLNMIQLWTQRTQLAINLSFPSICQKRGALEGLIIAIHTYTTRIEKQILTAFKNKQTNKILIEDIITDVFIQFYVVYLKDKNDVSNIKVTDVLEKLTERECMYRFERLK